MLPGMDHNDQYQRMYQQYPTRSQDSLHSAYGTSDIAARFRHPSTLQTSALTEGQDHYTGHAPGFVDSSQYTGSAVPSGPPYPQFSGAESSAYSTQHHNHATQYSHSYVYGHQATSSTDQSSQDHIQGFQSAVGRNSSVASNSSQYSIPTPQSQYFGANQTSQYPSRTSELSSYTTSTTFDPNTYTQPSGYSGAYQTSGQMLPPTTFGGYGRGQTLQSSRGPTDVDEAYDTYQIKAKEIFTLVREGRIRETHNHLLHISHYLLGNAEALEPGLDRDDKSLYEERLKLWDTFNNTWLTTMQAQLDLTQEIIANGGQPLPHPRSLLSVNEMEELGQELVKLCDGVSIFGLVDYQMGVAEEQILELLIKCLDLIAP